MAYLKYCLKFVLGSKYLRGYRSKDAGKAGSACRGARIASIFGKLRWLFWAHVRFLVCYVPYTIAKCKQIFHTVISKDH